jgi:hypothetical protein
MVEPAAQGLAGKEPIPLRRTVLALISEPNEVGTDQLVVLDHGLESLRDPQISLKTRNVNTGFEAVGLACRRIAVVKLAVVLGIKNEPFIS